MMDLIARNTSFKMIFIETNIPFRAPLTASSALLLRVPPVPGHPQHLCQRIPQPGGILS